MHYKIEMLSVDTQAELEKIPTADLKDGTLAYVQGTAGEAIGMFLGTSTYNAPTNQGRPYYMLLKSSTQAPNGTTFVATYENSLSGNTGGVWARLATTFV